MLVPPDGSAVDVPKTDSARDHVTIDLTGLGGFGGSVSTGGRGGGSGGSGGTTGTGGTGGGVVQCDPASPDRETDILNCGLCFKSCVVPNSDPLCVARVCRFNCFPNFFDADKDPDNGCECVKTNAGVEACDGLDNNCDGVVDEGFNFMTDPVNCGSCNTTCSFPFATASCMNGVCRQGACLPGFYDRDPMVAGCETNCETSNGGVEICDGQDNDCDGVVDDSPMAGPLVCKSMGVCMGVQPTCMGQTGWVCAYPATQQDVEDTMKGCDGLDNDCDGRVDEPFQIGQPCTVGSGACANPNGMWVCDNTMTGGHRCNGTPKPAGTETCNGLDDDCDGKVDELESMSNRTSDDKLIVVNGVTMFAYEATRYDATGTNYGFDSTKRPCSVSGRLPWSNVTKEEAETACERVGSGWRLCTAAEWLDACNSSGNTTFPYGGTYSAQRCNGADFTKPAGITTLATGTATMCASDPSTSTTGDELWDMSGNVKEWVLTTTATTGPFEMRGGAYNTPSFTVNSVTSAPGLQCDATTPAPTSVAVRLPSVGFRCCRTGTLPN